MERLGKISNKIIFKVTTEQPKAIVGFVISNPYYFDNDIVSFSARTVKNTHDNVYQLQVRHFTFFAKNITKLNIGDTIAIASDRVVVPPFAKKIINGISRQS